MEQLLFRNVFVFDIIIFVCMGCMMFYMKKSFFENIFDVLLQLVIIVGNVKDMKILLKRMVRVFVVI